MSLFPDDHEKISPPWKSFACESKFIFSCGCTKSKLTSLWQCFLYLLLVHRGPIPINRFLANKASAWRAELGHAPATTGWPGRWGAGTRTRLTLGRWSKRWSKNQQILQSWQGLSVCIEREKCSNFIDLRVYFQLQRKDPLFKRFYKPNKNTNPARAEDERIKSERQDALPGNETQILKTLQ